MLPAEAAAATVFECPDGFEEVDEDVICYIPNNHNSCEVKVMVSMPNDTDGQHQLLTLDVSTSGDQMHHIGGWHSTSCGVLFGDVIEEVIEEVQLDVEEDKNKIEENEKNVEVDISIEEFRELNKTNDIDKHNLSGFMPAIFPNGSDDDNNNITDIEDPLKMEINIEDSPVSSRSSSRRSKNGVETLLIYPSPPSKGGVSINTEDYKCLGENKYLNDAIIDFYLKYIYFDMLRPADQQRTHIFSSHFFTRLVKSTGYDGDEDMSEDERRHAGVQRWTKNVNIFEKDFVIVPINEYSHWYLVIICFANLIDAIGTHHSDCFINQNELQRPCLLVFDSLGSKDKFRVAKILRSYLYVEYLTKMGEEKDFSKDTLKTVYVNVPQQTNATDCGLYVLQYVENFFKNPIQDFTLPFRDLSKWFDPIVIMRKREELAELITNLAIEFSEDKRVNLPEVKFPKFSEAGISDNEDDLMLWRTSQPDENSDDFETTHKYQLSKNLFDPKPTRSCKRNNLLGNNKTLTPLKNVSQDITDNEAESELDKVIDVENVKSKRPIRKAVSRSIQIQETAKNIKGRKRNEDTKFFKKNNSTITSASKFPGKGNVLKSSPWVSKNNNNDSNNSVFSMGIPSESFYNYSLENERAEPKMLKFKRIKRFEELSDSS